MTTDKGTNDKGIIKAQKPGNGGAASRMIRESFVDGAGGWIAGGAGRIA